MRQWLGDAVFVTGPFFVCARSAPVLAHRWYTRSGRGAPTSKTRARPGLRDSPTAWTPSWPATGPRRTSTCTYCPVPWIQRGYRATSGGPRVTNADGRRHLTLSLATPSIIRALTEASDSDLGSCSRSTARRSRNRASPNGCDWPRTSGTVSDPLRTTCRSRRRGRSFLIAVWRSIAGIRIPPLPGTRSGLASSQIRWPDTLSGPPSPSSSCSADPSRAPPCLMIRPSTR
jgi:hypothetical protein